MKPWLVVVVTMVVVVPSGAQAQGTLRIGEPTVELNQVTIPVFLSGSIATGVAAMDFRVNYDPNVLRPLSAGAGDAAADANKRVMANETGSGEYVVVLMGMNQTTFTSGEVARIVMERTPGAEPSQWKLGLSQPTLSGTDGTVIESTVAPYTPSASTDGSKDTTDTTPDKPDTKDPANAAERPGVAGGPLGAGQPLQAATLTRRARRGESGLKRAAGERAQREFRAAREARDEARGAIGTPSTEGRTETDGVKTNSVETSTTDAKTSATGSASADSTARPLLLTNMQTTVESMRSNPESRGTASRTETASGFAGAAWKAMAAGTAAGVVVAILSLVLLRRKVFG